MTTPVQPFPRDPIAANAERIARVLNRTLSPKRLSGAARDAVTRSIAAARISNDLRAFETSLDQAALMIQPADLRSWVLCRLLLEGAWAVPPGSRLEDLLASRVRRLFVRCKAEDADHFSALREEFIALQRSSLPVVRRLVRSALIDEPVEESELAMLNDPLQAHDTRASISSRILSSLKVTAYDDVLGYYVQAIRQDERGGPDAGAREAVEILSEQLDLYQSTELMEHLLPKFAELHSDPAVSGKMMKLLRGYGMPLVKYIVSDYSNPDFASRRPAFAKLLGHMTQHGHVLGALQAMTSLLMETRAEDCADLVVAFKKAASGTSGQDPHDPSGVRTGFQEAMEKFEESNHQLLRDLARYLRKLPWNEGISAEFIEQYLRGDLPEDQTYRILNCGAEGFEMLAKAACDANRPDEQRQVATKTLGMLRNTRLRKQVAEVAWGIYLNETVPAIRAMALGIVIKRRRPFNEAESQRLLQDDAAATGVLRVFFDTHRDKIFVSSILDTRADPPGGNSTP